MPEGDTVYLLATRLRAAMVGQTLIRTDIRVPRFATTDLTGQTITEVVPRGKHLLQRTDGGITIHSHLRMQGSWHVYPRGARWRAPAFQARAVLDTAQKQAVAFDMPVLEIIATADEHTVVGHLGPDPLGPDWDLDEAMRRIRAHPDMTIGEALLDQRLVAGWGNAYKVELCYLKGLDPYMLVREVEDLEGLLLLGKKALEFNRPYGRQITTGSLRPREGQWIFERHGKPCPRCGDTILRAMQPGYGAERLTYWCPTCQPASPRSARPAPFTGASAHIRP